MGIQFSILYWIYVVRLPLWGRLHDSDILYYHFFSHRYIFLQLGLQRRRQRVYNNHYFLSLLFTFFPSLFHLIFIYSLEIQWYKLFFIQLAHVQRQVQTLRLQNYCCTYRIKKKKKERLQKIKKKASLQVPEDIMFGKCIRNISA